MVNTGHSIQLDWFFRTFVPDPDRGYALMNPPEAKNKYIRKHTPLTSRLVEQSFNNDTRRLFIKKKYEAFPLAIAVVPEHRDGWGFAAINDVDYGGQQSVQALLDFYRSFGLWAFAQLGQSCDHNGGHVYIPSGSPLPVDLLKSLAEYALSAVKIKGEAFPRNVDLRLPLQMHLHAPNGPTRFPLLMQTGEIIDANDPWKAITILQDRWNPNSPEAITQTFSSLSISNPSPQHPNPPRPNKTPPTNSHRTPRHKSKVVNRSESVIGWYNDQHPDLGLGITAPGAYRCPWHDDRSPSFVVWEHQSTGHLVGRCFSQHSNCSAALEDGHYLDAFGVYCLEHNLDTSEAVKQIAQENNLGQKRKLVVETKQPPASNPQSLQDHLKTVTAERSELSHRLYEATNRRGEVTIFRVTPGGGKTFQAAALANQLHNQGKAVAIVAPSHQVAEEEWMPHLKDPFLWQPRIKICTCYPSNYLQQAAATGYSLPECKPGCPYHEQKTQRKGKITIYQHNHLHLNHGELLDGYDVIIIDESPLNSLLQEQTASQDEIHQLTNQIEKICPDDPSLPLLRALIKTAYFARQEKKKLQERSLIQAISANIDQSDLLSLIKQAQTSNFAVTHPPAPNQEIANLPRQFWGKMLLSLKKDVENPAGNSLLVWTQVNNKWCWAWFERYELLDSLYGCLNSPAIIVLDGSAKPIINQKLFAPWKTQQIDIDIPLSPNVRLIQCPSTASTRRIVQDKDQQQRVIRTVATVCNELNLTLDGGITYLALEKDCEEAFGGTWLHYGGQRGSNALTNASTIALIASPTAPPGVIERKTMALWYDDIPLDTTSEKVCTGYYRATDPRLEEMNQLHGPQELYQAVHRARPILSIIPTTILVFSPWPLAELDLPPSLVITQTPHGNSLESRQALEKYQARRAYSGGGGDDCNKNDIFNSGVKADLSSSSVLTSAQKIAAATSSSVLTSAQKIAVPPPATSKREGGGVQSATENSVDKLPPNIDPPFDNGLEGLLIEVMHDLVGTLK